MSEPTNPPALGDLDLKRWVGMKTVTQLTNYNARTIHRLLAKGAFPEPVRLTKRRLRWQLGTILDWMERQEKGAVQ